MERKLASIRVISNIRPIKDADMIEVATVDNWNVVVKKNEFKIGDKVIYFEIDSFLPIREEFEFLRKSCYKKLADDSEGFRLRTITLRGQISQGLIMPLDIASGNFHITEPDLDVDFSIVKGVELGLFKVGSDVSNILGVVKYDPPMPPSLAGMAVGYFPSFIQKTDEERIQNLTDYYEEFKKYKWFASEKADGTSSTFFLNNDEFGVCSRNLQIVFDPENTLGKVAIENQLEGKLRTIGKNLAIQGEVVGEGIQKNKYKLKGQKLLVYNIFDIDKYDYLPKEDMLEICEQFNLETVPTILNDFFLPETIEELLLIADGESVIKPNSTIREGLVWVSIDAPKRISFKTISNQFLLKYGE